MIKDKGYCDEMEEHDGQLLQAFNEQMKFFNDLTPYPKGTPCDFHGKDSHSGRTVHIELKCRNTNLEQLRRWKTVYLEPSKYHYITKIMESGYTYHEIPLYINFVDDGAVIYNFNESYNALLTPNKEIKNPILGKEYENRMELMIDQATIYKKDENGQYKLEQLYKNGKLKIISS